VTDGKATIFWWTSNAPSCSTRVSGPGYTSQRAAVRPVSLQAAAGLPQRTGYEVSFVVGVIPSGTRVIKFTLDPLFAERSGVALAAIRQGEEAPTVTFARVDKLAIPGPEDDGPAPTPQLPSPTVQAGGASWRIDPGQPPAPRDHFASVLLTEQACASGQSPEGRLLPPEIAYGSDEIVIKLSVREIGGDCPSNHEFPYTVRLSEPIGERVLVDGFDGAAQWQAAWWPWQRFLMDLDRQAVAATHALLDLTVRRSRADPPTALSLSSPAVEPDQADLRRFDQELAELGVNTWSRVDPEFFLGAPERMAADLGGRLVSAGPPWLIMRDDPGTGWLARRIRSFETPGGHLVSTLDETLLVWDNCSEVVTPPIVGERNTDLSPEEGIFGIWIDTSPDTTTYVMVDYTDPACRAHPVLGPIIEHALADD
jgi:hypothetical protein